MDQTYDYLIALHIVTSSSGGSPSKQVPTNAMLLEDSAVFGKIIYMCWATYDTRKAIVTDEFEYFVKPNRFTELSPEIVAATKVTNEEMNKGGIPLQDVIHRFNEALYINYISNNSSFCIVTGYDDLLTKILPRDAKEAGAKLQNHFFSFFNICDEVKKLYKLTNSFASLGEYLTFLQLKDTQAKNLGQVEIKNILRLIHRLAKDGHIFENPKVLNPLHQIIADRADTKGGQVHQNKKWNTFIRGKSPEKFRNPSKKWFIRMRGLPYGAREPEIMEFLRGIRIYKEDIVFLYDYEGRFTGEAYCQLHNEADFKEGLSFNLSDLGNRYIEVFETNENEFAKAKGSQFPEKRERNVEVNPSWSHLVQENTGILRVRGLPFSCTEQDIRDFFKGFNIVKDGVKRAVQGGKPAGECFVIFETGEEAFGAMSLNMEKIGTRFIELFTSNVRELESYLHHNFSNTSPFYSKENMPNISLDKRKSTLMMVGLPFNINKTDILKFFGDFNLLDTDVHLISSHSGKFSGNTLVTFNDELEAQRALKLKNLSHIGSRYVELYEYR